MKNISLKKCLSLLLAGVLIAAMTLSAAGCGKAKRSEGPYSTIICKDGDTVGKGATSFKLEIVPKDASAVNITVKTDETTVGAALLANEIIAGDDSEYGLYVKCVNGVTADFDVDGTYWAFYINGEYAMTGVDSTDIEDGAAYALKVE